MSKTTDFIAAQLAPLLPKDWRIIPYSTNLDAIDRPVLMLRQSRIEKLSAAPQGALLATITATIVDPATDPKRADDALDDEVMLLIAALQKNPHLRWSSAERVVFGDFANAYDLALESIARTKEG